MKTALRIFTHPLSAVLLLVVITGGLLMAGNAVAIHNDPDGVELDGATAPSLPAANVTPCEGNGFDWAHISATQDPCNKGIFNSAGTAVNTPAGSKGTTFIKDFGNVPGKPNADDTYFEPSSKDYQVINPAGGSNVWACKTAANATDKDDIANSYALAVDDGTNIRIYVGAERFDNAGTAFLGFWFFQQKVACSGDAKFTGAKTPGDVLLLANFSSGGTNISLLAFRFDPTCAAANNPTPDCKDTNLRQFGAGVGCPALGTADPGSSGCATINATNQVTVPWPTEAKTGTPGTLDVFQFVEAGVNLTALFGGRQNVPCFPSFLAETRSSDSVSATLKDFALGSFERCGSLVIRKEDGKGGLLGGATFKICPNPLTGAACTGTGDFTVADNDANDSYNTTAGMICIDNARSVTGGYTISETGVPAGYNGAPPQSGIGTSKDDCKGRVPAGKTAADASFDVKFINTPLSFIRVIFGSEQSPAVTKASIVCKDSAGSSISADSENGSADPALDDSDEKFSHLTPGTYTCVVVIDP